MVSDNLAEIIHRKNWSYEQARNELRLFIGLDIANIAINVADLVILNTHSALQPAFNSGFIVGSLYVLPKLVRSHNSLEHEIQLHNQSSQLPKPELEV